MQLPWRKGGCSPEWGVTQFSVKGGDAASFCQLQGYPRRRGTKGGRRDAASFCQLQGYPRRTQRGTKESGDGDPREMTANLDRAPPPARTVNRADRVFNPFAARHHSPVSEPWKRAWQHFGALNSDAIAQGGCSPEWGRGVKGGDAASFCQLQGYPRRTQRGTKESGDGDPREMTANLDRAPPPARTGTGPIESSTRLLRAIIRQFTVSEPDLEEGMAAFRCFDPVQMQLPWRRGGAARNGGGV